MKLKHHYGIENTHVSITFSRVSRSTSHPTRTRRLAFNENFQNSTRSNLEILPDIRRNACDTISIFIFWFSRETSTTRSCDLKKRVDKIEIAIVLLKYVEEKKKKRN